MKVELQRKTASSHDYKTEGGGYRCQKCGHFVDAEADIRWQACPGQGLPPFTTSSLIKTWNSGEGIRAEIICEAREAGAKPSTLAKIEGQFHAAARIMAELLSLQTPECPPDIWTQILAAIGDGDRITQAHAHASGPRQTFGAHHFLLTRSTEPRFTLIVFESREWRYGGDFTTGDLAELVPLLGEHLPPITAPLPPPKHVDPSQTWAELWRQGFSDGVRAAGRRV